MIRGLLLLIALWPIVFVAASASAESRIRLFASSLAQGKFAELRCKERGGTQESKNGESKNGAGSASRRSEQANPIDVNETIEANEINAANETNETNETYETNETRAGEEEGDASAPNYLPTRFARVASAIRGARELVPESFVFDTGGLVAPDGLMRHAVRRDPAGVASIIRELGYRALALGEDDLKNELEGVIQLAEALRREGIPWVASNLVCKEPAAALCDALVTASDGVPIFREGGNRVAFISLASPTIRSHLPLELAEALVFQSIEETLQRAVGEAREKDVDMIVAVIDDGMGAEGFGRTLSLAAKLPEAARPDLLMSARGGTEVLFARPINESPAVFAAPPSGVTQLDVRRLESGELDFRARRLAPEKELNPKLASLLDEVSASICDAASDALEGARLAAPFDREDLLRLSARITLERSGADFAILERASVRKDFAPIRKTHLSEADLELAIEIDAPLLIASVKGNFLKALIRSEAARDAFFMDGLEHRYPGKAYERISLYVPMNIDDEGVYRVVTTRAIAERSGLLPALPPNEKWQPLGARLRSVTIEYLSEQGEGDPRLRIREPSSVFEWYGRATADVNFGGTVVRNPSDYTESQLTREDSLTLGITSQADFGGINDNLHYENRFDLRYRLIRNQTERTEGDDLISLLSRLRFHGAYTRRPRVYIPEPFVELYLESEFTRADTRDFHHFLARPSLGAIFRLLDPLTLSFRAGFETELLDPNRSVDPGLGLRLDMTNLELLKERDNRLILRGFVDYFLSSVRGEGRHTLRATADVAYTLGKRVSIGLQLVVYGRKDFSEEFGVGTNATAFLRGAFYGRRR